jgi:hypothetical protein
VDLTRIADTDPGPPFTISVSAVRITEHGDYKVTGMVRNDGADVYGGISVIATFFTAPECGERYVQSGGGKGRTFDIRIAHAPYATYRVQAQAMQN